jgi:D-arabinose 1-dehydrogenase-like Zn-dependent alcohol dehydrogenase
VGIVVEAGSAVTKFKPGDRAGVSVFVDSCKECKYCNRQDELYCPKAVMTYNSVNYDGTPAQGGYSTHIVIHER